MGEVLATTDLLLVSLLTVAGAVVTSTEDASARGSRPLTLIHMDLSRLDSAKLSERLRAMADVVDSGVPDWEAAFQLSIFGDMDKMYLHYKRKFARRR